MKLGHRQQYYPKCLNHVFNAKALLESPFNQEKALVGAFFVIVKTSPKIRLKLQSALLYCVNVSPAQPSDRLLWAACWTSANSTENPDYIVVF